jgi:tetratricopeptide (TPR) repeat protein
MRFVDAHWRLGASAAICAFGAGCASTGEPMAGPGLDAEVTATAATATEPAAPAAPVNPAVQQAFDDARRALAAGQAQQAERGFRTLTQSNPELGGPYANLGLIHRQGGKLPEAVPELEAAVRASPQQPAYLNQLGVAYRQQGQFNKAREAYEKAIALAPDYAAPQLNLAILYDLYLGDGKRALEQYERYLALTPGGDPTVTKWVIDLRNRMPQTLAANRKDKE